MNITDYLLSPDIFEYGIIETADIPFSSEVVSMCEENRCGKYGTCWTCPPGVGNISDIERWVKGFKNAAVFTCKYALEDSFDIEGMLEGKERTKLVLNGIIEKLLADNQNFGALGCEGCNICEKCTYPDAPCRFPKKAIPAVEACGIHVAQLAKKVGVNYINGTNTITYFCMILF